jgi:hypothetical protein
MKTLTTLLVGAAIGALLAIVGTAALTRALNPSAATVVHRDAQQANVDPAQPPPFYGTR